MNVVGFEALVLEAVISRELFSCFATTPPGPPSCFYLSAKGKISHFDPRWPGSSNLSFLMFNSRDVQQSNTGHSDLKFKNQSCRKKNQSSDQSQFHMVVVVFFSALPPRGNVFRVIQQNTSYIEMTSTFLSLASHQ